MKVLGISGSGRKNGITQEVVKLILKNTEVPYEFIPLSDYNIIGCLGCAKCARDNQCINMNDNWHIISKKMLESAAIIFGAPTYYGIINCLANACLERTYSFRHREKFLLAGKLGISIGVSGNKEDNVVGNFIKKIMISNKMSVIDVLHAKGYSQCYTCGYGEVCRAGSVVAKHGYNGDLLESDYPSNFENQDQAYAKAYKAGKVLGSILKNRS